MPSEDKKPQPERKQTDSLRPGERAVEDGMLRRDRQEIARALSNLLPLERRETEHSLLAERSGRGDAPSKREDILGVVSHDLRNLLSGIVLSAAVVTETTYGSAESGQRILAAMDRIQQYAARMGRLIGDLVDVASIDAGTLSVRRERGDVTALLAETVDLFTSAATEQEVILVVTSGDRPVFANFDHERMLQVLTNLVANALRFTPSGGSISLSCERSGDDILLSVRDTGMGIPGHLLDVVFERVCQAEENDRRGMGLGLYVSKCIVESHDGRIWAESDPGAGSTFRLTIPVADPT